MAKIEAVIFDMDGLMFDTESVYYQANQNIADDLGMDYSIEDYKEFIGAGDNIYFPEMEKRFAHVQGIDTFRERSVAELEKMFSAGAIQTQPGLIELLDYLKAQGITTVVASSTRRTLVEELLDKTEVRSYFADYIGGDEVAETKPNPEIFEKAFEKTGAAHKENVLILEDSKNGILAANGAGITVIHIPDLVTLDEETQQKTDAIYDSLHEVIEHIEKINK